MQAAKKVALVGFSLFALAFVNLASAALFDDKEARKKITEVEAKHQTDNAAAMAAIADLKKTTGAMDKRIGAIEAIVQAGGLSEMQNQIEALKQEVAQLKGDLEVAQHNLENTQTRQKDLYTDTDTRLRRIEGGASTISPPVNSGAATTAVPIIEEKDAKAFADADALSKSAKHKEAFMAFDAFLKEYPTSKLAPDALYGMGYSQFVLKNYKSSIATQQKVIDLHSGSTKVPDAMYNQANSQIQLGQVTNAKKTLRTLVEKFPNADITPSAQKRLKALEGLK